MNEIKISLRDYFATKAMQAGVSRENCCDDEKFIAKDSYLIADAMLAEREKTPQIQQSKPTVVWHDAKKDLPEDSFAVLVVHNTYLLVQIAVAYFYTDEGWEDVNGGILTPIFWTEIPELPEEVK